VSKRTLRELYAKGFEKAVKEGGVKAVMSAYNAVNGKFSSYNKELLTDWLKDEWGFDGVVFSDSGAVTGHNDRAVAAGLDMVLHGATTECDNEDIVEAVKDGTLDLARLDDAVVRFLKLILWQRKAREENPYIYDQKKLLQCAYDTAVDGMVLLKNESVLPLDKSKKVVLFGSRAKSTMECGGGSTYVTTPLHGNLFDEFAKVGVDVAGKEDADIAIYAAGAEGGENADRPGMKLDKEDEGRIADVLKREKEQGRKTVVVLNVAGPVEMSDWIANADAVLVNFIPGCMGAKATTDVLLGEENPGGKLPVTFPIRLEDSPAAPYPIGEHDDVYYGEGIFVGYRWYDYKGLPVQYPFGFGLSYTDFEICAEDAPGSWNIKEEEKFQVRVKVKNVGKRFGSEVVQLYMRPKTARIPMPERELKAFSKVFLEPSEENTVTLTVKKEDLEVCDPERGMLIPIGEYEVELGTSSRDMFHCFTLEVEGENPYVFDEHSTLGEILANEEAMAVLGRYIPGMAEGIASMTPDMLKFMESEKIGPLLSRQMIRAISDTNELKAILDRLFAELAQVGNEGKVV
jgi:beta-glucosidase